MIPANPALQAERKTAAAVLSKTEVVKPSIEATMTVDGDHIVIRVPRKITLDDIRTGDKDTLFLAVRAMSHNAQVFIQDTNAKGGKSVGTTLSLGVRPTATFNLFLDRKTATETVGA